MSDVDLWSEVASENSAASPDGNPEGMARSGVNNSARETQASIKRWFLDPLLRDTFLGFTFARNDDTTFRIIDGDKTNAAQYMSVDQRLSVTGDSGTVFGFVSSVSYAAPNTTVVVDWDSDGTGPPRVPDTTPTVPLTLVLVAPTQLERNAYLKNGTTLLEIPPEVPTADQLGDSAFKDEADLDVGKLNGFTAEEIFAASVFLGNILPNPTLDIWSRGDTWNSGESDVRYQNIDQTMTADSYEYLSDGANRFAIARDPVTAPPGFTQSLKIEGVSLTASPNAEKVGFLVMLEHVDSEGLIDTAGTIFSSFSIYVLSTPGIQSVGIMAVGWSGTRDDASGTYPILDWQSGTEDVPVILGSNWSNEANQFYDVSTAWQRLKLENFTFNTSGLENIGILIYINERDHAAGDSLWFTGAQLEQNVLASLFAHQPVSMYDQRCARNFASSFSGTTRPSNAGGFDNAFHTVSGASGSGAMITIPFETEMMKIPTMSFWNPVEPAPAAGLFWRDYNGGTDRGTQDTRTSEKQATVGIASAANNNKHAIGYSASAQVRGNF